MTDPTLTRRDFLRETTIYGGGLWISLSLPRPNAARAAAESSQRAVLTEAEWVTLEAITGRIIPTDHEPGAIEAGCVNFIDKALAHEDAQARPLYSLGIAGTEQVAQRRFARPFAKLTRPSRTSCWRRSSRAARPAGPKAPSRRRPSSRPCARTRSSASSPTRSTAATAISPAGSWSATPARAITWAATRPDQMLGRAKIKTVWGEDL